MTIPAPSLYDGRPSWIPNGSDLSCCALLFSDDAFVMVAQWFKFPVKGIAPIDIFGVFFGAGVFFDVVGVISLDGLEFIFIASREFMILAVF